MLLNAAVRRALWRSPKTLLIVAALVGLALMSIGTARAQSIYPTIAAAWSACKADLTGSWSSYSCVHTRPPYIHLVSPGGALNGYQYVQGCAADAPWNPETGTCQPASCPGGAVRMTNGQCSATPEECTAFNSGGGFGVQTTKPFSSKTLANGCVLAMTPGTGEGCTVVAGSAVEMCNGEFMFTGQVDSGLPPDVFVPGPTTPEEAAQNTPQQCTPAGGGSHNYCVKSSGDHCMTSAQGRQLCWRPGETGTKTDGPVAQVRNAGTQPNAPALDLPSGDTLQATGQKTTATTNNTTTTTTNYTTVHGTNAGSKNQGEKGDGSGDGKEQDPDKNTASGGTDCDTKPIVSDPAFEMIANQAWATRCAVEAGNAAKVTGDVGDCSAPYTVEGENANAEQLRALRVQICGDQPAEWDAVGDAIAAVESAAGEGDPSDAFSDGSQGGTPGSDGELDTGGFGYGNSCPQLPSINVMGTTIDFNVHAADMCRWIQLAGQIVLVLAALASLRIIAAGGQ